MSNCINSGINRIFVLTQFNSASLNRHIARTYFGNGVNFGDGFVEVIITHNSDILYAENKILNTSAWFTYKKLTHTCDMNNESCYLSSLDSGFLGLEFL